MKEIEQAKIINIINKYIEDADITPEKADDDLTGLGMDSSIFIRIAVTLEEEFDCEIPDTKLLIDKLNTVNKIYEVLAAI